MSRSKPSSQNLQMPATNEYGVVLQDTRQKAHAYYFSVIASAWKMGEQALREALRSLCLGDLFFLIVYGLNCSFADNDWVFERSREVQANPDGFVDLWSREHYKSTVITFALTIQEILKNPEITICIFSVTRPMAKQFLSQIKREFEKNGFLKELFPDVLYMRPQQESPKWNEDDGLIVRRTGNPKEATLEAYGLSDDSQPTSKHYDIKIYDDVITERSVTSREMIDRAMTGIRLSMNLSKTDPKSGKIITKNRFVGTRWDLDDPYGQIVAEEIAAERRRPGVVVTDDGALKSVGPWSDETAEAKRKELGDYIFSCQILLDPVAASSQRFKEEWLRFWDAENLRNLNIYIVVDPAGSQKGKDSDYTVFNVFGVDSLDNRLIIKLVRDRLNLVERTNMLFELMRQYPRVIKVGYEQVGMQADIEHIQYRMKQENFRFTIVPLGTARRITSAANKQVGGKVKKEDAISALVAPFEAGRIYLPYHCWYTDYSGAVKDMTRVFIDEEYLKWYPGAQCHDDMFDTMHMMFHQDLDVRVPNLEIREKRKERKALVGAVYSHRGG